MQIGPTTIVDAHAEAFAASYTRLIVTATDEHWLTAALTALCGYGTSLIGCDCEIAVERFLCNKQTPDRRIGASVLAFAFSTKQLGAAITGRVGQGLLTCPTVAVFDGLPKAEKRLPLGDYLRYFGDGHEERDDDHWRLPIMEGDFTLPCTIGTARGVAGGNLILQGIDQSAALAAARRAVEAIAEMPDIITPFPGGVCRSGSKVGSRYRGLVASTNDPLCPTLRDKTPSQLVLESPLFPETQSVYEIILNGTDEAVVRQAMRIALHAAPGEGLLAITAGDYDGRLGKVLIPLHELIE